MKSWYAVRTRSNYESKVHDALISKEIPDLYPTYETHSQWSDRKKRIFRPLFPGYLFAALDFERQRWRPILSTLGVRSVVCVMWQATCAGWSLGRPRNDSTGSGWSDSCGVMAA